LRLLDHFDRHPRHQIGSADQKAMEQLPDRVVKEPRAGADLVVRELSSEWRRQRGIFQRFASMGNDYCGTPILQKPAQPDQRPRREAQAATESIVYSQFHVGSQRRQLGPKNDGGSMLHLLAVKSVTQRFGVRLGTSSQIGRQ
jgi:hypothetical protein